MEDLLQEIVTTVRDGFDYYGVMLMLLDKEGNQLTLQSIAGGYLDVFPKDLCLSVGEGMIGYAAETGEIQISNDVSKDPNYIQKADEITKSELAVPIISGTKVIGVLDIQSEELDAFEIPDITAMETLSSQIGAAIDNARLYEQAKNEITERKRVEVSLLESEERYRQLVHNANDIIYRTDANGYFTFVNPVALRVLQYSKDEIIGRRFHELICPEYRGKVEKYYVLQFMKKNLNTYYEFPVLSKDGKKKWLGQNVRLVMENDKIIGFESIARDITDRKRVEEERERLIVDLREALAKVKTLSGLVPICSSCKKVRDDKGYWNQVEDYVHAHSNAEFSHSLCPECVKELYPDFYKRKEKDGKKVIPQS